MASPNIRRLISDHSLLIVGTIGGVAVAAVTVFRKPSAPVIEVSTPAAAAGPSSGDLLSAFGAGASAASSGFDTGAQLGQAGIAAAGQAEQDVAGVAQTLAGSQAELGGSLAGLLQGIVLPAPYPTPQPLPVQPLPTGGGSIGPLPGSNPPAGGGGTVTPPPPAPFQPMPSSSPVPCAPSYMGKPPSGAKGFAQARAGTYYLWVNTSHGWHEVAHQTGGWSAFVAAPTVVTSTTGGKVTVARILTGGLTGQYVHVYGSGNPTVVYC